MAWWLAVCLQALILQVLSFPGANADTGLSGERTGVTDGEVVLGSCAPLSGQQKLRGLPVVEGGRTYFNYINDHGGVNGRKIKLVSCDDRYNVDDGAITCFNTCLKDKVFLGTLFQGTSSASRYVTMGDINHMPIVGLSTGGDFIVQPTHHYIFQVRACYSDEATAQINALWNKLNLRRIAIVYQDDAYGVGCRKGILAALAKVGGQLVAEASYPRLSTDVQSLASLIRPANPDALVIAGGGKAVSLIAEHRKDFGNHVQLITFSSSSDLLTEQAGRAADGTIISQVLPLEDKNLPTVQLYKRLTEKAQLQPSYSGFEGFLIGMTVVEGLKRAGKDLTRDGFVEALESIHNFDIGLGKEFELNFSPTNHDGLQAHVSMTMIKNGQVEPISDWHALKQEMAAAAH